MVEKVRSKIVFVVLISVLIVMFNLSAGKALGAEMPQKKENSTNLQLYARSAVLMDADSGRVLFGKNENEPMPMASTTKIMTCIIALENGNMEDVVTVSQTAVSQPKVHLGMYKEQKFRLRDLLYSLMLESHNDSAVAIAEHVGGSVEGFADLMNQKAERLGCTDTFFITPNGLDARIKDAAGNEKMHSTTARDLARIMAYCIGESDKNAEFLEITRTPSYTFSDAEGKRSYSCYNHNAFLSMMDGALSGKTGFTGQAGYCYVGALKRDERTFIVALLACGWPGNKSYKWSDARQLMNYGLENYQYRNVYEPVEFARLPVEGGIPDSGSPYEPAFAAIGLEAGEGERLTLLLKEEEQVERRVKLPSVLTAPVRKNEQVGSVGYYLEGELLKEYPVIAVQDIEVLNFGWIMSYIWKLYSL